MSSKIKLKFKSNHIIKMIIFGVLLIGCLRMLVLSLIVFFPIRLEAILITGLCLILVVIMVLVLNDYKHISYNKVDRIIKVYSLLDPFGRMIICSKSFKVLWGREVTAYDTQRVLYFVDENNQIVLKLNTAFYSGFWHFQKQLDYQVINYTLSAKEYFKLLYFGTVQLGNIGSHQKGKSSNYIKILQALGVIGGICFVLMQLIRFLS